MSKLTSYTMLIAVAVAGLSGCADAIDSPSNGKLTVNWEIRPRGCTQAGVEEIQVDLAFEKGTITERYPCKKGGATIADLRPANYTVQLWGIDEAGDTTYEAESRKITVHGGNETVADPVRLTARPGDLRVVWRFANGRVCGANDVESIEFALYDTDDFRVRHRTFDCPAGSARITEVPPGEYLVELRADTEASEYVGFSEVRTRRGKSAGVEVVLEYVDP
ncbi:MAG: hypothetical protein ABEN55_01100 [Bradymonadaceae bacterium]